MDLSAKLSKLQYVSWNQDRSCICVGTSTGFSVLDTDPLKERFRREFEGIRIVEILGKSNILALVARGRSPKNKVLIWDDVQGHCVAELEFASPVKGVKLRKESLVVALESKVYMYNFSDVKLIDQHETYANPLGLCAMCSAKESIVVACMGEKLGQVRIENYSRRNSRVIDAHNNPISQMCLSADGTKLATASTRGTLIRIFDTHTGERLSEFRRGSSVAVIHCLAFNKNGSSLCLTSDKGTVHLYSCVSESENRQSSFAFMSSMVPILGSAWSARQFTVPESHSICSFGTEEGNNFIYVLGGTGKMYKYSLSQNLTIPTAVEDYGSLCP